MLREGDRIHYSGDLANEPGWFRVELDRVGPWLVEENGDRRFTVSPTQIGDVYKGHCSPRFVTEAAYRAFYAAPGVTLGLVLLLTLAISSCAPHASPDAERTFLGALNTYCEGSDYREPVCAVPLSQDFGR